MSLPVDLVSKEMSKFVESSVTTGQTLIGVANGNGTPIGTPGVVTVTTGNLTALNSTVTFDPTNYRMMYFTVTGTFNLTFTLEFTIDGGANWNTWPYHGAALYTTIWQTANTGSTPRSSEFWGAASWQMRVRASAYTSGTGAVSVYGCSAATFPTLLNTMAYTQGYIAQDAATTGQNPVLIGSHGSRAVPAPVAADGNLSRPWSDRSGRLIVSHGDSFSHITTATTTSVKATPGKFERLIINKTLTGTVTIYDNTSASGTILAAFAIGTTPQSITYGAVMGTGITVVTSAADDITVTYAD